MFINKVTVCGPGTPELEALMKSADIDSETIAIVMKKMADPFDEH